MMTSQVELTRRSRMRWRIGVIGIFNLKRDSYYDFAASFRAVFGRTRRRAVQRPGYRLQSLNPDDGTRIPRF